MTVPEGVRSIGNYAFKWCTSLKTVRLSEGLVSIGKEAFSICSNLEKIDLPASVTDIGADVFEVCDNVTVSCYTHSAAHKYAADNSIPYVLLDADTAVYYGDTNGDGSVNLSDVARILQHIAKWDVTLNLDAADVTGDGLVNLADASLIMKHIAKWDVTFK